MKQPSFTAPVWIYTDGACSKNPGPGGWAFSLCFFDSDERKAGEVLEGGGADPATTNNRMETEAVLSALDLCAERQRARGVSLRITIYTDSNLLIQGATQWIHGWKKKNWIKSDGQPVLNRDLWERLDEKLGAFASRPEWCYVPGHSGVQGNERVDEIAVALTKGGALKLYKGSLESYSLRGIFSESPAPTGSAPGSSKSGTRSVKAAPKGPASYLSVVAGRLERHSTWAECEARVKGTAGAKFKKVSSAAEERELLKKWGLG